MPIQTEHEGLHVATRIDDANGTAERIELRGAEGRRVFSCVYLPPSRPRGAVLICPALHSEFTRNYRREVLLARRLAEEGFAVERFHYRGTGNSDGDGWELSFETMREDAANCLEHLLAESGLRTPYLVGTRWGALVAASVASAHPEAPVVMWEPLLDASRFFRDAFRTRLIFERKSGVERPSTGDELAQRLREGEAIDIVGHTLEGALYVSSADRTLEQELGVADRSMLLLQIGPSGTVRREYSEQSDRWRTAGLSVDVEIVKGDETWWLVDERWHDEGGRPMTKELIERTTRWFLARSMG